MNIIIPIQIYLGAGLFGLGLLNSQVEFKKYTFTDVHHEVLNAIITNLKINFLSNEIKDFNNWLENGPSCLTKITNENVAETNESFLIKNKNIKEGNTSEDKEVAVKYLDWLDYSDESLDSFDFDIILGSDLTYAVEMLGPLAKVHVFPRILQF